MDTKEKQDGIQDHLNRKVLGLGFMSADMTETFGTCLCLVILLPNGIIPDFFLDIQDSLEYNPIWAQPGASDTL